MPQFFLARHSRANARSDKRHRHLAFATSKSLATVSWIVFAILFSLSSGCIPSNPTAQSPDNRKSDAANQTDKTESAESEEDNGHTEHFVPAHYPKHFSAAVARLTDLLTALQAETSRPKQELSPEQELIDLVRWLPSLAADSDLGESDWNVVYAASISFETQQAVHSTENSVSKEAILLLRGSLPELQRVATVFDQMQIADEPEIDAAISDTESNPNTSSPVAIGENLPDGSLTTETAPTAPAQKEKN